MQNNRMTMAPDEYRMQEQILKQIQEYQRQKREQERQDEELARQINFNQMRE
jgi:hypothetical protein